MLFCVLLFMLRKNYSIVMDKKIILSCVEDSLDPPLTTVGWQKDHCEQGKPVLALKKSLELKLCIQTYSVCSFQLCFSEVER